MSRIGCGAPYQSPFRLASNAERAMVGLLVSEFKMVHMTHQAHGQSADLHAGHKMSEAHAAHDRHAGHSVAMFRDKFWLCFALTIPVVFWSSDVQHWSGAVATRRPWRFTLKHTNPLFGEI